MVSVDSTATAQTWTMKMTVCYPGFDFVNASNKFLGGYKNFNDIGCQSNNHPVMQYNIFTLENISWNDYPYSVVSMAKEECGKSCLQDCNCGAVLYIDNGCSKYKLPLR